MTRRHFIVMLFLLVGPLCAAAGAGQLTVLKALSSTVGGNPQGPY